MKIFFLSFPSCNKCYNFAIIQEEKMTLFLKRKRREIGNVTSLGSQFQKRKKNQIARFGRNNFFFLPS